jgi:hypothetical protein
LNKESKAGRKALGKEGTAGGKRREVRFRKLEAHPDKVRPPNLCKLQLPNNWPSSPNKEKSCRPSRTQSGFLLT